MSKYSEAVSNIRMLVGCNELHFDDIKVLQEACGKAEKYDELNNTIPMWVDKVEEEAPRNPVDRVKRLIQENERLNAEKKILVDGIKALFNSGFIKQVKYDNGFERIAFNSDGDIPSECEDKSKNEEYSKIKAMLEIVEDK